MLNPALVQSMTAEALCESLIRTQQQSQQHKERADQLQAEVDRLKQENADLQARLTD